MKLNVNIVAILLTLVSFSATANMQYGYPPAPYYGYQAPAFQPYPSQYYQPRPHFEPVRHHSPVRPFPGPHSTDPVKKAPETINEKTTGTIAVISNPDNRIKPAVTEVAEPKKPEPKKVLPDSKLVFLQKVAPIVHKVNTEVRSERERLLSIIRVLEQGASLNADEAKWLQDRLKTYRVDGKSITADFLTSDLLPKVDIIPVELALAQAANESAWGKSRFAREAQNLFGVWTYDESQGIVPKKRAKGAKHLVRKYESMEDSIRHYITLLNSHPAYQPLRTIRLEQRESGENPDGFAMAEGLIKYSAKGEQYVAIIRSMISKNNLAEFRSA
jgi:Bax protein